MTNFDYKKYSLEKLEEWVNNALDQDDISPEELYELIRKLVVENYQYYRKKFSHSSTLLNLFDHKSNDVASSNVSTDTNNNDWTNFWEEHYYPEEVSDKEYKDWTHPESALSKNRKREYNLREAEYYNKRARLDAEYEAIKAAGGYEWTPEPQKDDKVVKWQLPVEIDASGEYFVTFPDDLLDASNLKEGDQVEWVDNKNGTYTLCKITKPLGMDEC